MPRFVKDAQQAVYGKVPLDLPVYTHAAVEREVLRNTVQQYDVAPLNHDDFEIALTEPNFYQGTMEMQWSNGINGLGALPPVPPQTIKTLIPEPVQTSTVYGVVGLSVLAIIGSIAAWAYFSGRKGK